MTSKTTILSDLSKKIMIFDGKLGTISVTVINLRKNCYDFSGKLNPYKKTARRNQRLKLGKFRKMWQEVLFLVALQLPA